MSKPTEATYEEIELFEGELEKLIKQMDDKQLSVFYTVLSAKNMVYFSDDFFKYETALHYINALFIYLGCDCNTVFNDNDIDFEFERYYELDEDVELSLKSEPNLKLDFELVTDLDISLDLEGVLEVDFNDELDFFVAVKCISNPTAHRRNEMRERILFDANKILSNDLGELFVFSDEYKKQFNRFLQNLIDAEAKYWAEWFEEIFENKLKLTKNQIDDLMSLNDRQFFDSISDTSDFFIKKRKRKK